jgi:uncharacterized protein YlxW (UPF0749 family)
MHATDPPEHLNAVNSLREELDRLVAEQIEAMKTATFRIATADEDKEYEVRRARILELVKKLRSLEEAA